MRHLGIRGAIAFDWHFAEQGFEVQPSLVQCPPLKAPRMLGGYITAKLEPKVRTWESQFKKGPRRGPSGRPAGDSAHHYF